jgi:hypothetical protein
MSLMTRMSRNDEMRATNHEETTKPEDQIRVIRVIRGSPPPLFVFIRG